jgi:hypothetical protein
METSLLKTHRQSAADHDSPGKSFGVVEISLNPQTLSKQYAIQPA